MDFRGFDSSQDNIYGLPDSAPRPSSGHGNSFYDPIYETLSTYKHHGSNQWSSKFSSGFKLRRGEPPPLPPKPKLMSLVRTDILQNIENINGSNYELGKTQRDERGFTFSFVWAKSSFLFQSILSNIRWQFCNWISNFFKYCLVYLLLVAVIFYWIKN